MVNRVPVKPKTGSGLAEVLRLYRKGLHPYEIVDRLRGRLTAGSIKVYLHHIRKAGLAGREALGPCSPRIAPMSARSAALLAVEAEKRAIDRSILAGAILERVLLDDLVGAVLDDAGRR